MSYCSVLYYTKYHSSGNYSSILRYPGPFTLAFYRFSLLGATLYVPGKDTSTLRSANVMQTLGPPRDIFSTHSAWQIMEYEALHAQHLLEFVYMSSISTGSSITNDGEVLDT
jgi:hypothetical protein